MTKETLRILNEEGLRLFRAYLSRLRKNPTLDPPREMLTDAWCTARFPGGAEVEERSFKNRLEAAEYLFEVLRPVSPSRIERNVGLWSWLSLFYFDQVCPAGSGGRRKPGKDYRHILDPDFRRFYRHILAGSYTVFSLHGGRAPLLLHSALTTITRFHEELASRHGFITNHGVIEAANLLYFDEKKNRPKPGSYSADRKPGTLLRFIDVVRQLDLTYDLYSMTGDQVLSLLPAEFDPWQNPHAKPQRP